MKTASRYILACLALATAASADVLELKNGQVQNGKYAGGDAATVRFQTAAGVQAIETSQIVAVTFTSAAPKAPAAVRAPAGSQSFTLPAGTTLLVRLMDSVSSKSSAGSTFTTKLEYDLGAGTAVAVKGGTVIYGKVESSNQARRAIGKSKLDLRLTQIVIAGQPVPISTSGFQEAGEASIKKAARGAAGGAAIGAIAGDAAMGAAIGAVAGALKRGETVTITPGTLLEFTLEQPVTIQSAN